MLAALREETTGGALLLAAALVALCWANSPWRDGYQAMREATLGPGALHLDLSLAAWAADGLLAVFFFVAGLELKREVVCGQLSRAREAVLPVAAAVAGMVVPALVYLAVTGGRDGTLDGWAVPMATDIAFALAVLAVIGTGLPTALRAFLLTLAVVDDLGAILVIALFFTAELAWPALLGALVLLGAYAWLQHRRVTSWWIYLPLALAIWALVHASGVHATVAGVALGLLTRVRPDPGERHSPAERLEHRIRPFSAGVAVPAFALTAAGVSLGELGLRPVLADPATLGVAIGLVLGKFVGVFGGSWLVARWTRAELSRELAWADVAAVALLAGIGFTVSLLMGELAFGDDPTRAQHVKVAVLVGSTLAALAAAVVLRRRNRTYRHRRAGRAVDEKIGSARRRPAQPPS